MSKSTTPECGLPGGDEYAGIARLYDPLLDPFLARLRRVVAGMAADLGAGSVVDVCCGTGRQCQELHARGLHALGVDASAAMLRQARRKSSPAVAYVRADAARLPLADRRYDAAVISFALHEMAPGARHDALEEAARVARRVVVADYALRPGPAGRLLGLAAHLPERVAGRRHYACFLSFMKEGATDGLLAAHGLRVVARQPMLLGAVAVAAAEPRPVYASPV